MVSSAPNAAIEGEASNHLHTNHQQTEKQQYHGEASKATPVTSAHPPPLYGDHLTDAFPGLESRRSSIFSIAQLDQMLPDDKIDTDTYGVTELRDGFFDGVFLKPSPPPSEDHQVLEHSKATLPAAFDKTNPLAPKHFLPRQWHEIRSLVRRITTSRSGIHLLKSFTAYSIAYVLCLIPAVHVWLGRYHYVMAVSVIINHPARTFGSQLEGAVFTTLGTAAGLGWGVVGLILSTSTLAASAGYGGILALFLAIFMGAIAWIRSFLTRFYQAVLCAGIAITFTTLAETGSRSIQWPKILSYAIPWLLGQAIALIVNCVLFPDAGAQPLAKTFYQSFDIMLESLVIPHPRDTRLRQRLSRAFVDLSKAYRDLRLDVTISRFPPNEVGELRNLMQAVIRALLSMETETVLFNDDSADENIAIIIDEPAQPSTSSENSFPGTNETISVHEEQDVSQIVVKQLATPTKEVLLCIEEGLRRCQASLMNLSGCRQHLGPAPQVSSDVAPIQIRIRAATAAFDSVESTLLASGSLPPSCMEDSEVVRLFVFARHVREAATTTENLMAKVYEMRYSSVWPRFYLPSYPIKRAVYRSNAQVRHDRGGATAGSYYVTFVEIAHLLNKITARDHKPFSKEDEDTDVDTGTENSPPVASNTNPKSTTASKNRRLGYRIWRILYHLQGFDSRYAFKTFLMTSLLSIPSYLDKHKHWWDRYEAWWAVAMSWVMIHPRVGGNLQDLVTRAFVAILGAVWSGAAFAAGNGNSYVMAVFAAIFMLPMLYRFTQSSHPRSGLIGCISFTVISLRLHADGADGTPALTAVLKGIAFLVGTVAPVIVNWVLWPFVARRELRHSLSSMMFFMSVMYRSVIGKYIYFREGREPTPEDVIKSEILEGHLREGFLRIRQLMVMTRHEIRLRAPFDPLPYSALADACEHFFEHLIAVRQSALFYNPNYIRDNPVVAERLLAYRRDAVAAILANLYILAGALRSQQQVPRYLPSAAAARKRLLVETITVKAEMAEHGEENNLRWEKKWNDIYSYSYNESLTGCVTQLEELEKYTKLIVGEQGFENGYEDEDDDENEPDNS